MSGKRIVICRETLGINLNGKILLRIFIHIWSNDDCSNCNCNCIIILSSYGIGTISRIFFTLLINSDLTMAKRKRYIKLFDPELVGVSIKQSFVKLNPRIDDQKPGNVYGGDRHAVMLVVCYLPGSYR